MHMVQGDLRRDPHSDPAQPPHEIGQRGQAKGQVRQMGEGLLDADTMTSVLA